MTELEKMEYAKTFIDKLANGINPLDDSAIKEEDIVNNVRLSRCFFYVSDILRRVIENGGIKSKNTASLPFNLSAEQLLKFDYSDKTIPVSEIAKRINYLKDDENMKNLSYKDITNWLLSVGMLCEQVTPDGKTAKRPTEQGKEIGITTENRVSPRGAYTVTVYNRAAQEFIIDNFDAIKVLKYKN